VRIYGTKLDTKVSSFSLDNAQLSVGEVSTSDGTRHKGIAVLSTLFGNLAIERAFVVPPNDAASLVRFLDAILANDLPAAFTLKASFLERLRWTAKKLVKDWHGGGGYRGRLSCGSILGAASVSATITRDSARALRTCIAEFYAMADR
jgi:hypothetical protein